MRSEGVGDGERVASDLEGEVGGLVEVGALEGGDARQPVEAGARERDGGAEGRFERGELRFEILPRLSGQRRLRCLQLLVRQGQGVEAVVHEAAVGRVEHDLWVDVVSGRLRECGRHGVRGGRHGYHGQLLRGRCEGRRVGGERGVASSREARRVARQRYGLGAENLRRFGTSPGDEHRGDDNRGRDDENDDQH